MSRLSGLNRGGARQRLIRPSFSDPSADKYAICQGCGMPTMHSHLRERMEYQGGLSPQGTGLWVCARCDDVPQPYFQMQILRPDPAPEESLNSFPDINQDPTMVLELDDGSVLELDDGSLLELTQTFPEFWQIALPNPADFDPGYQIDVLFEEGGTQQRFRAVADGTVWRRLSDMSVVE